MTLQHFSTKHKKLAQPLGTRTSLGVAVRAVLFGISLLPMSASLSYATSPVNEAASDTATTAQNTAQSTDADTLNEWQAAYQRSMANDSTSTADNQADIKPTPTTDTQPSAADNTDAKASDDTQSKKLAKRLGFENDSLKSTSLAKLAESYQPAQNDSPRCEGVWVQPARKAADSQNTPAGGVPNDGTIFAQADYGYYNAKDYAELSGNVVVEQNGQQVLADKITFNPTTGQAEASGNVQFSDGFGSDGGSVSQALGGGLSKAGAGIIGVADKLSYNSDGSSAIAQDVAFASTTINAHGYAGNMQKVNENEYQMNDVMFTTCPPTERKWYLDAGSIDINNDTGRAVARNTTLRISDVPVLYLPYFNFPIDDRRASGFLLPSIGIGTSDSLHISTPYYLNLAPNYDATITPTVFINRNPMLTGEFRYLNKYIGQGVLTGSYLPSDRKYNDKDRSRIRYDHTWQSTDFPKLTGYATYQYVSDADYLTDFDMFGLESRTLNLPRHIGMRYYDENVTADLRVESFQRLDAINTDGTRILDKDRPYSRLPQLSINYRVPKSWMSGTSDKVNVWGVHNSAYFKKSITDNSAAEKSGARMYNQISANYPILRPWGYVTPKLSLTHLYASYDQDSLADQNLDKKDGSDSVFAPTFSVDSGLFLEKQGSPFGRFDDSLGGYQVLSPRLKYTYTPYKDQSNIPNFDTTISPTSYDQLMGDTWFLGYDRIQDLHAITPALNYRYIDSTGRTRFDGNIAEQIFLDDLQVGIDDSERFSGKSSGMAWQASIQPRNNLWFDTAGAFTPSYDLNAITAQVRYQPSENQLLNFGIIERKENRATNQPPLSAYTASAIVPMGSRWSLMAQAQYDYKHNKLMDSLLGLNYEDCCYGLSVYARHYRDNINPFAKADTAVMAEVRLNGITSGGKLNRLLSDKILGYDNLNNAWRRDY